MMSTIELIAAEWAWLSESGSNVFDEDAVIERHRNLETAITHFRPRNPKELALYSLMTANQVHLMSTDYKLDAPIDECGRAAFTIRDCLCEQIGFDHASLQAEVLSGRNGPHDGLSVIQTLAHKLSSTWDDHADLDRRIVSGRGSDGDQAAMEMKAAEIQDIELAMAACRVQSSEDLAIVVMMFASEAQQDDWPDEIQRDRRLRLWSDTIAEYQNRDGASAGHDLARRYVPKHSKTQQALAAAAE